ncbi:MAG: glycoside hydrolase [Anaerolineae bacterium]|nr:glycoside hydrolase [Anaerolineae bacterium]
MGHPLYVAFLWHMHQPDYRDPVTGMFHLPWVRLHAAKDYLHMAEVLAQYPDVHATVNFAPILVEQLAAYAAGAAEDRVMRLGRQDTWTEEERAYILNLGFSVNRDKIVRRYPPYMELLQRREAALHDLNVYNDQEYRDILAWFQLAWTDPNRLERDDELRHLITKGHGYSIEDLQLIIDRHIEMCARVIPLYRELAGRGQIELTASPYTHPILPLLIDSSHAQRATPGLPIPDPPFRAREDVAAHLRQAISHHEHFFGTRPVGIWPSEGAVSQEAVEEIDAAGFRWLASDEAILGRCLGRWIQRDSQDAVTTPHILYQPYVIMVDNRPGPIAIFRDHVLSDRIGFTYQHIPGEQAAEDLIVRLQIIRRRLADPDRPYLVAIILDGENCWEGYDHNGDIFLHSLYHRLSEDPELKAVTVSEYLEMNPPRNTLARIATGSWIRGDLTTWMGDPEHIQAWSLLRDTREALVSDESARPDLPEPIRQQAWQAIYAAEGSDWFWWYSVRNTSDQDGLFDELFRNHLANVYRALGRPVPETLMRPIAAHGRRLDQITRQRRYITPRLTALPNPGEGWKEALCIHADTSTGTMQQAGRGLQALYVAYDADHLHIRIDVAEPLEHLSLDVRVRSGAGHERHLSWYPSQEAIRMDDTFIPTAMGTQTIEMSIPFETLGIRLGDRIWIQGSAARAGGEINRVPASRPLEVALIPLEA